MFRTLGFLFSFALAATSLADSQTFARRSFGIKAGVVVIESARAGGEAVNFAPHVWYNLDSNTRIKPRKVNLFNHAHDSTWTNAEVSRWTNLAAALGTLDPPAAGAPITKRDAPYWEVRLASVNDSEINEYDILLLPAYGYSSLNTIEREKLRSFCDKGGVLWVDLAPTSATESVNNFPIGFQLSNAAVGGNFYADYGHPLFSVPGRLNSQDLAFMQTFGGLGIQPADVPLVIQPIQGTIQAEFNKLQPLAGDNFGGIVNLAKVGDGYMVVTTRGVARALNYVPTSPVGLSGNVGPQAETPSFNRTTDAAAKLALNMIYLTAFMQQNGAGSRRIGGTPIDVEPPLLKAFDTAGMGTSIPGGPSTYVPPVVYKGLLIVATGDRLQAFDADPKSDVDGDGDSDDGIRDLSLGFERDLVWESGALGGPLSAPTAIEVPDGAVRDQVLLVDIAGNLMCFNAFPSNPTVLQTPAYVVNPPGGASEAAGAVPLPPTVHENLIFVADQQTTGAGNPTGRIWVANAATGSLVQGNVGWSVGGSMTQLIPPITGSPTVGYIPIADNSGGLDKVVYVPTAPNPSFAGPNANCGMYSFWLGARGERPSSFAVSGNQLIVATRASGQGLDIYTPGASPLGVKITLLKSNGDAYTAAEMVATFTGAVSQSGGILNFTLQPGVTSLPTGTGIRLDYHINWGTGSPSMTSQILRGFLLFPDDNTKNRRVIGNLALSPQGTLHAAIAVPGSNFGVFFSVREEGRGSFRITNRYDMYPAHTITLNQASAVRYGPTLIDTDPLTTLPGVGGFLAGDFQNLSFSGGPVVNNGVVYVVARGFKNGFVPCSVIMAFKSEPEVVEIKTGDLGTNFTLLQPDQGRSNNKNVPEVWSTLQPNQFIYEREPGSDSGTIRIENLSATTRGPILNAISLSQPVVIRRAGQPDLLIDPPSNGSRYNPLLWFMVLHGDANISPPIITGNSLFFCGTSSLPSLLTNGSPFPTRALVSGLDIEVPPNDPFIGSAPARPWQKQLYRLKTTGDPNNPINGNPAVVWPQASGLRSFEDFRIRLLQTVLGNSTQGFGVVAGPKGVYAWSQQGVWGFTKADFLVADEGRIARFDGSGNALWTSDTSFSSGQNSDSGNAANAKPVTRPTRAYPFGDREMVVVDPGSNRIIRMDLSGREIRTLEGFKLDPLHTPEGMTSNDTLFLRNPRDVIVYTSIVAAGANPFSNALASEYWVHYFVADSGNKRLLEIVDRYSYLNNRVGEPVPYLANGQQERGLGMLFWHSPAGLSGGKFDYNSVARVYIPNNSGGGRYVYAAGLGNTLPTRADTGLDTPTPTSTRTTEDGNGGVVIFDGASSQVINQIQIPALPANIYWDDASGTWLSPARNLRSKTIGNLSSVTLKNVIVGAQTQLSVMLTDSSGVYEVVDTGGGNWTAQWMMTRESYKAMRRNGSDIPTSDNPMDFRPTYARRLESGEVLIVNGYHGAYRKNLPADPWREFTGEVIQIDGDIDTSGLAPDGFAFTKRNLGFRSLSVKFLLPPVQGARGIVLPVYADRR